MVAAFGLHSGQQLPRFNDALIVERNLRLSVWWLLEHGALADKTITRIAFEGTEGGPGRTGEIEIRRATPHLWIDGTRVLVSWHSPNPNVAHPFFECPVCSTRTRFMYLRDRTACRRCHRLDWACRHLNRRMPSAARVVRLRRRPAAVQSIGRASAGA